MQRDVYYEKCSLQLYQSFLGWKKFSASLECKKKIMREQFEKDFSEPFRKYFMTDHTKAKDLCIDCVEPVTTKEKVSIAFMKEVGDDFTRKTVCVLEL